MAAYLCIENHLETKFSSIAASVDAAGAAVVRSWDMSGIWTNNAASNVWVRHILSSSAIRDTCIVWGQNAVNADDIVVYNGNVPTEIGRANHLGNGEPIAISLTEQSTTNYEVWIESSTNYSKGFRHVWIGNRIEIPGNISGNFVDPRGGRDSKGTGFSSRSGVFTGVYSRPQQQQVTISIEDIEDAWYQANWATIADHLAAGKPFYFIPEFTVGINNQALLCWCEEVPQPRYVNGCLRQIDIVANCIRK